ncbi:MAG: putative nucleotidyltransferase substrate binding domain-containing protein [Verrucomicrobiia bacterium]
METQFDTFLEFSPVSRASLELFPEWREWILSQTHSSASRTSSVLQREAKISWQPFSSSNQRLDALRRMKRREMVLIGFQDWSNTVSLQTSMAHLSALADLCIQTTAEIAYQEMREKGDIPETDFLILGLGKLGGNELNYSSDVDLILFYGEEGQLSQHLTYHEWFERWGRLFANHFTQRTKEGNLFRLDLRLRPEGDSGPLTRSLDSAENYYAAFGETWERLALMKARRVAGSAELTYELQMMLQSFCYPKNPSSDVVQSVAHLKQRMETELLDHETRESDLKRGIGGIREIEFIVQVYQLLHGGRHTFLQETSTLKCLEKLNQTSLMSRSAVNELREAYLFFRRLEHRIQMREEAQTHLIPANRDIRTKIAKSLGFSSLENFDELCTQYRKQVRGWFDQLIEDSETDKAAKNEIVWPPLSPDAQRTLQELQEGSNFLNVAPRTKQLFRQLESQLAQQLSGLVAPSDVLIGLERFIERYGSRGQLYETWLSNPKVLELLLCLFDSSRWFRDLLVNHPDWLEMVCREGEIDSVWGRNDYEKQTAFLDNLESLRLWRWEQGLRIAIQDALKLITPVQVETQHSALAESCVHWLSKNSSLIIIAAGKFGGKELSYGSDLDLVFLEGNPQEASQLLNALVQATPQGHLYHADARLRPEGEAGALTLPIEQAISYYQNRAQTWEFLAFTKFRPICGDTPKIETFMTQVAELWRKCGQQKSCLDDILDIKQRVETQRAHGTPDDRLIKTGRGGLMDIEFITQTWQMRRGFLEPSTRIALEAMKQEFHQEAEIFLKGYALLRQIESALRKWEFNASAQLPSDEKELESLAQRAGFISQNEMGHQLQKMRQSIRASFDRVMQLLRH